MNTNMLINTQDNKEHKHEMIIDKMKKNMSLKMKMKITKNRKMKDMKKKKKTEGQNQEAEERQETEEKEEKGNLIKSIDDKLFISNMWRVLLSSS